MSPVALLLLVLVVGPSAIYSAPLLTDLIYDDVNLGSWNSDVYCKTGPCYRSTWPYERYVPTLENDVLDSLNPTVVSADLLPRLPVDYVNYPKTVDLARENYVRGSITSTTEVGTRDEITLRPSVVRTPFSRFYSTYFPSGVLRNGGAVRYVADKLYSPVDYDVNVRRSLPSVLPERLLGDTVYLRK